MPDKSLGEVGETIRGFPVITFDDIYGHQCSLQISSLADKDAIWLGIDDAKPQIMASKAAEYGVKTGGITTGWVDYPIPKDVLLSTRMHLDEEKVKALVAHLQHWLETREL